MEINIRKENIKDINITYNLVKEAFENAPHSDADEHNLVNRLRRSECYIPELSLLAIVDGNVSGHIMFTKLFITNEDANHESLALAPLSVLPKYQNKGIGSKLVNVGLKLAKGLGYKSVIVLGSKKYYSRFGFKEALNYGIRSPFEVPSENFMVIELVKNCLKNVQGNVIYDKEFFEKS